LGTPISGFTVFDRFVNGDNFISVILIILFLSFLFFIIRRIKNHKEKAENNVKEMIKANVPIKHDKTVDKKFDKLKKEIVEKKEDKEEKHKRPKKIRFFKRKLMKEIEKGGEVSDVQAKKEIDLAKKFSKKK